MTDGLIEFVKSGVIGPIQLGVDGDAVRAFLGDPPDAALPPKRIWKYGALELAFDKSMHLDMILLTRAGCRPGVPPPLAALGRELAAARRMSAFITECEQHGVELHMDPSTSFDGQRGYRSASGVWIVGTVSTDALEKVGI